MTTYAALTDGTTTVTFASPGSLSWYRIETGWAPQVAGLRQSQLGGRGPYEDVTEEIPISIGGSSDAHLYSNINTLKTLLDQANRWYYGEQVNAVTFKYSPEGATVSSAGSPLIAPVWNTDLNLSNSLNEMPTAGTAVWASGLTMRFTRPGTWLHNSASGSASGLNGSVITVPVTAASAYSPTNISVNNISSGVSKIYGFGFSDSASGITAVSPDTLTATYYTTVAKTYGRGGSVLQYAPSVTTENAASLGATSAASTCRRMGAMLNIAASPASASFNIRIQYYGAGGENYPYAYTNSYTYLPAANIYAEWINLGAIKLQGYPAYFKIFLTSSSSSASAWIDSVVFFDFTNTGTYQFNGLFSATLKTTLTISNTYAVETYPSPTLTASGADYFQATALGDLSVSTSGGSVYCIFMGNDANAAGNNYQQGPASIANAGSTNTWTVTRRQGYLSPV